jgi:hypothetical protein
MRAYGNDLETSDRPCGRRLAAWSTSIGRLLPALLPSPSAEPAAAVKGRRPDPERSERVDSRPPVELFRRRCVAARAGRAERRAGRSPRLKPVRVVPVAAGEDASEASARSRAAGGERSEPPLRTVERLVTRPDGRHVSCPG